MRKIADYPFSDRALSTRLERAEGRTNAWSVEARERLHPGSGAGWMEVGGAYVMFDAVGSPLTQTFGLGLLGDAGEAELRRIEEYYRSRGSDVYHEISPLGEPGLPAVLAARGYRPVEFSNVLYRPIGTGLMLAAPSETITVRPIEPGEEEYWAEISAEGWSESPELADFILDIGRISARREGSVSFLAELGGHTIAAGGLSIFEGVALLAGASTIPSGRNRGAQLALLEGRLMHAAEAGCDVAMMVTQPGSASQRNAERQGFRIAYTRTKWGLVTTD